MTELPVAPASERNKRPILEQLLQWLPTRGELLEIGAGTGQHAVYFAAHFPGLQWQASDRTEALPALAARLSAEGGPNLSAPIALDVMQDRWPARTFAAAYSANTSHIMGWPEVCAMFSGVGRSMAAGGPFCLYGPFNRGGQFTAPSNGAFDADLRARDPRMGLRDVEALETLAGDHQMNLERVVDMPANNLFLVFRRSAHD